jgi:hypothetical protein
MKVRISYGVDLNEVPHETARMLHECSEDIQAISSLLTDLINDLSDFSIDRETFNEAVENCRYLLVKTDSRLNDNLMIMGGFYDAKELQIKELKDEEDKAIELEKADKRVALEKELEEI